MYVPVHLDSIDTPPAPAQCSKITHASTIASKSLIIIVSSPSLRAAASASPSSSWKSIQSVLGALYHVASKSATDVGNPLLDVTVVLEDVCGYDCWVNDAGFGIEGEGLIMAGSVEDEVALLPAINSRRQAAGLRPLAFKACPSIIHPPTTQLLGWGDNKASISCFSGEGIKDSYDTVALGGTFDHLHSGHKILLAATAWLSSRRVICGVVDFSADVKRLERKKAHEAMQPLDERLSVARRFLENTRRGLEYDVVPILDDYGPTKDDPTIGALVGSLETEKGIVYCNRKLKANDLRKRNNLPLMDIFIIDVIGNSKLAMSGDEVAAKISSSYIREMLLKRKYVEYMQNHPSPTMDRNSNNDFFLASFFCTSCNQPIRLDPSLLESSNLDDALAPLSEYAGSNQADDSFSADNNPNSSSSSSSSHVALPASSPNPTSTTTNPATPQSREKNPFDRLAPKPSDSFVVLSRPATTTITTTTANPAPAPSALREPPLEQRTGQGSLSHRLKVASRLFDLISGVSEVEHPLCVDCADDLQVRLEKRLHEVRREREGYAGFLKQLEAEEEVKVPESSEQELEALREKEENALKVLRELEAESLGLKEELAGIEAELKDLDDAELRYWQDVNTLQNQLYDYTNDRDSITLKFEYVSSQLEKLRKTNVYNDAFRIWHDGPFGTIN
ncbi:hypothetical protein HK101_011034, partial [Irineochytrium annulatum]